MRVYFLGSGKNEKDTWILIKFARADCNEWITISAPAEVSESTQKQIRECFLSTGVINWSEPFGIADVEVPVAKLLLDLHVDKLEPIVSIIPSCLFYLEPEVADMDLEISDTNIRLGPLDLITGTPFIADNWEKCTNPLKTTEMVKKSIEKGTSGGLYLTENGIEKLVCGAVVSGAGTLAMLWTHVDYRRRGYAALCIRYIFRVMVKQGMYPCLVADLVNKAAMKMYDRMGFKEAARVIFIQST